MRCELQRAPVERERLPRVERQADEAALRDRGGVDGLIDVHPSSAFVGEVVVVPGRWRRLGELVGQRREAVESASACS